MPDKPQVNRGKELLGWEVAEYHEHARGKLWFVVAALIGLALIFYSLQERNFLFAFIVIMVAVILITHSIRPSVRYYFGVYELGVGLGGRFYPWKELNCFWMAYEPPEIKTLYVEFTGFRPRLPVPLEDTDPNSVRQVLKDFVEEDTSKTDEPISDWIARVLKI